MKRGLRTFLSLLLLLPGLSVSLVGLAKPQNGSIDYYSELKRFVEHPPIIKSMVVYLDSCGLGSYPSNWFELRYQPGAVYVKRADRLEWLPGLNYGPFTISGGGVSFSACFDRTFWVLDRYGTLVIINFSPPAFEQWQTTNAWQKPAGGYTWDNSFRSACLVMNMGLPCPKVGALHWNGNRTEGVDEWSRPFTAELVSGTNGRPAGVHLQTGAGPAPFNHPFDYTVWYEYGNQFKDWPLPTRFSGCCPIMEVRDVELGSHRQPEWRFHYNQLLNHKAPLLRVYRFSNRLPASGVLPVGVPSFDEQKEGMARCLWWWIPIPWIKKIYFVAVCLVTMSVVIAWRALAKWKPTEGK